MARPPAISIPPRWSEPVGGSNSAISEGADLVVLSKFGKLEAARSGLADAFRAAIEADLPILTVVSPAAAEEWELFAAPWLFQFLDASPEALEGWVGAADAATRLRDRPVSGETPAEALAETRLEIALHFANGARLGPDELRIIAAIRKQRSILGASRATGVAYRTCWLIVDALNRAFEQPVIATHPGRRGGGAELTPFGERLVAVYDFIVRRSRAQAKPALSEIAAALNPSFERRATPAHASADANPRKRLLGDRKGLDHRPDPQAFLEREAHPRDWQ